MKKITLFLVVFAASLFCSLPSFAESFQKTKIAVIDFELQGEGFETADMGSIVAEWFITALVKDGRFEVIERGLLKKILDEQKLGMSGVVDEQSATKIGKLLGVKVIISGSVMKLGEQTEVNARIIDVESASIIAAENVKSYQAARLQDMIVQMSQKIIKNFPLEGYIVNRDGKKVTIDLGLRAGVKSDMEFVVYKEGKVIKHPKTGEVLDVERIQTGKVKIKTVRDKISDGVILNEEKSGDVAYGQLVQSLAVQKKTTDQSELRKKILSSPALKKRIMEKAGVERGGAKKDLPMRARKVINMIESGIDKQMVRAGKMIGKSGENHPAVFEAVNSALLKGYKKGGSDRTHVDAMSWFCRVLGDSGNAKYKSTLELVKKNGSHRKLQGYADKAYRSL
ncbi:MAG: hypothetical protein KAI75_04825 [Desulfobulbaceae bacterium]|nr:hypothetical protein [Desulfobulbaceae bacterium]